MLAGAAVALAAVAHAARERPGLLWAIGWSVILGLGCVLVLGRGAPAPVLVAFLGPLLPGAQLAGALAFARDRAPVWVMPAALGVGLLGALAGGILPFGLELPVRVGLEPAASLVAAGVMAAEARRPRSSLWVRLVPPLLVVVALLDGASGLVLAGGGSLPLGLYVGWSLAAAVGIPLQLHVAGERRLRRQERSAEAQRIESEERFRALTENAFDLVAELDADERFTYVNPRYEELLGHPAEALLGRPARDFIHPDDQRAAELFAAAAAERGTAWGLVVRARHRDGSWVWLESAARSFLLPDGTRRWVMSSRDVTERRAVEETHARTRERLRETVEARTVALHASEARFRALADHAPELISEFDDRGRYLFANAAFRELLGREPWDLIGTRPLDLIHPDDLRRSRRSMVHAYQSEGPSRAVHRLRHADGSWRWFDNTGRAYRTADGELRFVSIGRDVTEARRAEEERQRLETHMREVQRLESLGVLAGGIAHDFNNLLAVILGNAALLEARASAQDEDLPRLRRIRAAGRHAQGLTEQMLTYAGRSSTKLRPLDLSELVRETEDLVRAAVSKNVKVELELAADLPQVDADATQLRQVLLNLVSNASEALGDEGGRIRIRTSLRRTDPAWLSDAFGTAERDEGPWVELRVADDGPGIDTAMRSRIFEPFYSTKGAGRGLGLASVLGIAAAHRGLIVLEGRPGEGTSFHLLVPPCGSAEGAAPAPPAEPRGDDGRARTVLVVDDEDAVREIAQTFLERAGFRVVTASGGREALERAADLQVDAVLLDLAMPDLSGAETLRRLRERRPGLPVAVASGYGRALALERLGTGEAVAFVAKPYDAEALAAAIGEALALAARPASPGS